MRSRTARLTSMALGLVAAIGPASGASAYWTSGGSGTASATTGNLSSPTAVTATQPTAGVATVRVTWTAPAPPSVTPAGYYVQRFVGATASPACGSSPTSLLPATATACDDTGVAPGSYSYRVTAVLNSWTATSASSGSVTIRSSVGAPTPTSGSAGSSVTISGSGFAAGSALTVKVVGTTATVTAGATSDANGSASLTFTVPALPAGAYTVSVTDAAGNTATSATSFTIVANPATKLAFTAQPASGANVQPTGTGTFSASVAVQDASGNVRTMDNTTVVTLAIGTNPSAGVLACTNVGPVTVTNGVANFTGCSITKAGTGYKLTATSSPALTAPANANSFNITAGTAVGIVLSDITISPTPALGAPTGAVGSLTYSSTGQASNSGNVLTARISLADQNQNVVINGTGSAITVGLALAGSGTLIPSGPSALSIANGASTSSTAFTLTRSNGGKAVTLTATVAGTTQTLTVRMES